MRGGLALNVGEGLLVNPKIRRYKGSLLQSHINWSAPWLA